VSERIVSLRLAGYLGLASVGLMAGAVSGRSGLVALAAPFALAAVVGSVFAPGPVTARAEVDRTTVDEGDEVTVSLTVEGRPGQVVELAVVEPVGVELPDGRTRRVRLAGDGTSTQRFVVRAQQRGSYRLGVGVARTTGPLGCVASDHLVDGPRIVRVRPAPQDLRSAIRPSRLHVASGSHPAVAVGPGAEFSGLRPYQVGDRARDVSWRASARRDALMVAQRHPDRGADVVVFVDTFAAEGIESTIRASLSVVRHQLDERDRVGVVAFGGSMRAVRPGVGRRQLELVTEALVDVRPVFSWADKEVRAIPPKALPAGATILVVSPLVDERTMTAVVDLRRRRHDIGVVEVSPLTWAPPPVDEATRIARRLWEMERAAHRRRMGEAGVPVVEWRPEVPLEVVMRQLTALRRGRSRWRAS
jgi:uncharacterized protein (DUF58 family)